MRNAVVCIGIVKEATYTLTISMFAYSTQASGKNFFYWIIIWNTQTWHNTFMLHRQTIKSSLLISIALSFLLKLTYEQILNYWKHNYLDLWIFQSLFCLNMSLLLTKQLSKEIQTHTFPNDNLPMIYYYSDFMLSHTRTKFELIRRQSYMYSFYCCTGFDY